MRTGHLFAGIDGIGLGLTPHGFETVWFSEYEDAPSRVLAHHYPGVPNHGDITTIDWSQVEPVDVLTGGFPCQDLSYAGRGAGIKEGTRSGLWSEYVRAIRALRPRIVIVENVAALLRRGLDIVLADLHESGFDAEWSTLRASDVGAAHRRERLFIVAVARDADGSRADPFASEGGSRNPARQSGRVAQDADVESRVERRVAASRQAEGGWARAVVAGRGRTSATADASGVAGCVGDGDHVCAGGGTGRQRPAPGRGEAPTDGGGDGCEGRPERDVGTVRSGQQTSRRGDPVGLDPAAADSACVGGPVEPESSDSGRSLVGAVARPGDRAGVGDAAARVRELGRGAGVAWGEYAPAIERWERVVGRPAPAPTVDGRLSAEFVEWHMGFPEGWTASLKRTERLKALGNAVVPQCADVIGRWALEIARQEVHV